MLEGVAFFHVVFLPDVFSLPNGFLVIHIGKPYESVVRGSTFPVLRKTAIYPSEPPHPSSTWISTPVIITFDDKQHGFTLPATGFGAIGWSDFKAITLTTSPMLETLPFEQAVLLLDELQQKFKQVGWTPEPVEVNDWLKIETKEEKIDFRPNSSINWTV